MFGGSGKCSAGLVDAGLLFCVLYCFCCVLLRVERSDTSDGLDRLIDRSTMEKLGRNCPNSTEAEVDRLPSTRRC